jgi:hypothetical protein
MVVNFEKNNQIEISFPAAASNANCSGEQNNVHNMHKGNL